MTADIPKEVVKPKISLGPINQLAKDLMNGQPMFRDVIVEELNKLSGLIEEQERELKLTQYYKNQIDQMNKNFGSQEQM